MAASRSAASATVRASGPCVSRYGHVGNHAGARHEPERRLHSHDAGELRRNAVRAAVVGAERGERHAARDGDRRAGARAAGRAVSGAVVRIEHLSGVAARAVAVIGEVVGGGLAEDDARRPRGARVTSIASRCTAFGKEPRPLGVRPGGRKSGHVVDRFREHGNAVERAARRARAQARVGGARLGERRVGERVDRAPSRRRRCGSARARGP